MIISFILKTEDILVEPAKLWNSCPQETEA